MAACAGAAPMTSPSPGPASWSLPLDPLDPWDVLRRFAGQSPGCAGERESGLHAALVKTRVNSMVSLDSEVVKGTCGGVIPKSVMVAGVEPARLSWLPLTRALTVAVASFVTPWMVSCPGTVRLTSWPSPAG